MSARYFTAHRVHERSCSCSEYEASPPFFSQPQVDLSTGRMSGVEALVRWEHPERGLLTPDAFLPCAESTGVIAAIDDWVLREACMQMRAWDHAGLPPISVAVNVSAASLMSGNLADTVVEALRETGADPARLEIELTETVAVEHDDDAIRTIWGGRGARTDGELHGFVSSGRSGLWRSPSTGSAGMTFPGPPGFWRARLPRIR